MNVVVAIVLLSIVPMIVEVEQIIDLQTYSNVGFSAKGVRVAADLLREART
jgi:hypothetical protein